MDLPTLLTLAAGGLFMYAVLTLALAHAEPIYSVGEKLPQMLLFACRNLADAQKQANVLLAFGRMPYSEETADSVKQSGCGYVRLTATLLYQESSIRPYVGWVAQYDRNSKSILHVEHNGRYLDIPNSPGRQEVRWFYSDRLVSATGDIYAAWIEMPDRPAVMEFLKSQTPSDAR
jgi:hypothetical protein